MPVPDEMYYARQIAERLESIEKELRISNTLKAIELCKSGKLGEDFNEVYQYVRH